MNSTNQHAHVDGARSTPGTTTDSDVRYMTGFGNGFESEALAGTLPIGHNSPQRVAHGLYAEQLSGSPFTAPRHANERSWLYRILPSVRHGQGYTRIDAPLWRTAPDTEAELTFGPERWDPVPFPEEPVSFIEGLRTITTAGDASSHAGIGSHIFLISRSMVDEYFYNGDGEMLFVLEQGAVRFWTEFGIIDAAPGEIVVIPRGVKIRVEIPDGPARGYLCENYGAALTLPERGPIGANCLANPRDFLTPEAAYETRDTASVMYARWGGQLWRADLDHSPLDVVAWHGNYAPYKYDLSTFSPIGPLLFDHADPSIFTTLTSPSETPGTANLDFVIFPDRWVVTEHTFRPPWFHMNVMSEFMGLIRGHYDAKQDGFVPGGFSLHNAMTPHGPDAATYAGASIAELEPTRMTGSLAFMFETAHVQHLTRFAASLAGRQLDYSQCWDGLTNNFKPERQSD